MSPVSRRLSTRSRRALVGAGAVVIIAVLLTSTGVAQAMVRGLLGGPDAPGNDALAAAAPIDPEAVSIDGTTAGAGSETVENDAAAGDATVWYRFTPTVSGVVYLAASTDDPPTARVYTGAVFPLSRVDADGAPGAVSFDATAGITYLIQVDSATNPGEFDFSLLQQAASGPDNDAFASATSLGEAVNELGSAAGDLASGTTSGATVETGEPAGVTASVWYSWTVPSADATLVLTVDGEHTLGSFTGADISALQAVTADSDGGTGITLSGTTGAIVYVRVGAAAGGTSGTAGDFTLSGTVSGLAQPDTAAPVVTCTPPTGWTSDVAVHCTAVDAGSGLAAPADASVTLIANVPAGASASDVVTGTQQVCDKVGNCATAGPITGLQIDRAGPVVDCAAVSPNWLGAQAVIDCGATDSGSGLATPGDAAFTLVTAVSAGTADADAAFAVHPHVCDAVGNCTDVTPPHTARVDLAPPVVHCDAAPSGWHGDDGSVDCTATDADSGLANPDQKSFALGTTVGGGAVTPDAETGTATVCDTVGNCAIAGPIGGLAVDRAAPVIHCTPPVGWHAGHTATVPCTATDSGSGLAESSDAAFDLTVGIPAGTQSAGTESDTRKVCDAVENCATAGPYTVPLDDQPPAVTCQPAPVEWQNAAVRAQCAATDADGSGVAETDSAFTLTADVPNGSASDAVPIEGRQVCDEVGNCATTPSLADGKVDRVTPQAICGAPGGVHHAEVTVTCTATDTGSGLADPGSSTFTLRTSVGAGKAVAAAETDTRTLCDLAGNCTVAGPAGPFHVDRAAPAPGGPPTLGTPGVIHVLSARPETAAGVNAGGAGAVPVPFDLPAAAASAGLAVRVGCNPEPNGLFPLGRTLIVCAATDDADRTTTHTFPVDVQLAPDLAPSNAFRVGGSATVRGRGFWRGTVVRIELDGDVLGAVQASGKGLVGVAVTIPSSTAPGAHSLVLRGIAADGQPELVVIPVTVTTDQQALVVAKPTGGTVPSGTATPTGGSNGGGTGTGGTPPPVTTTLAPPPTTSSARTGGTSHGSTSIPPTLVTVSGQTSTGSGTGTGPAATSGPRSSQPGSSLPGSSTPESSSVLQTFGGGAQTTTSPAPPAVTTGPPEEAGGSPQSSAPVPTSSAAGGSGGIPGWLWWVLAVVLLALLGAGAFVVITRRR